MNATDVYRLLKGLLSELTGLPRKDIKSTQVLTAPPLRFTTQGKFDLSEKIKKYFAKHGHPIPPPGIQGWETAACDKVRDVRELISTKFGS